MSTPAPSVREWQAATQLAYAPPPMDDEPLDGYLEHIAGRTGVQPSVLHRHLGLRCTTAYGIVRGLSTEHADRLAKATEIPPDRLTEMTLRHYAPVGLMPPPDKRGHGTGAWARGSGARYCPECLRERDLRWRLSWYLQWSFACTRHARLLHPGCPACGRPVRSHPRGHPIALDRITADATTPPSGVECGCRTDLLAQRRADRPRDLGPLAAAGGMDPILRAQDTIHDVIHRSDITPLAFGVPRSRVEWLLDLAALTRLLLTDLPADHIPVGYLDVLAGANDNRQAIADLLEGWGKRLGLKATASPASRLSDATFSPVAIALAASAATGILTSSSIAVAGESLRVLPQSARQAAVSKSVQRRLSWSLVQALDNPAERARPARARLLRVGTARYRGDGTERWPLDPARVPARLWAPVLERHPRTRKDAYAGFAASVALLSIGTRQNVGQVCHRLGHTHLASRIRNELAVVLGLTDDDSPLFADLVQLHDAVSTAAVPIDYARRRRTFPHPVTPADRTARRIARDLGLRPTPRLRRFMGWWVFELLTGSDVLLTGARLELHASHRLAYARLRHEWDAEPPNALLRRAEHALLVNCLDEPITWSPRATPDVAWICPPPDTERLLDGWANRRGRATSRLTAGAADGLELQEATAFAASGQSRATTRLAVMMARFATIVEVGTITQAANKIGLRQSSLTDSITSLERELGVTLIDRTPHGFTVTDTGRRLYRLVSTGPLRSTDPGQRLKP